MKSFNLERAKAGDPVMTRDGRAARIICFDKKGKQKIVALIQDPDEPNNELFAAYNNNGSFCFYEVEDDEDLVMATKKTTCWINVYRRDTCFLTVGERLYSTKEEAESNKGCGSIGAFQIDIEE